MHQDCSALSVPKLPVLHPSRVLLTLSGYVQDLVTSQMHGKLLVDGVLYPTSYGTNVGEQCAPVLLHLQRCGAEHAGTPAAEQAAEAVLLCTALLRLLLVTVSCLGQPPTIDPERDCPACRYLEQINLANRTRTASYHYGPLLPDPSLCVGTHTITYSNASQQCAPAC